MKHLYILFIAFVLLTNGGCKKFLEESSQDEIKPGTVQDLISLMSGEGYPYLISLDALSNFLSDDIQCNGGQGFPAYITVVKKPVAAFSWSKDMYEELVLTGGISGTAQLNSWQVLYKQIASCNVVMGYIDKVKGDDVTKGNLKGQALAMRAYYYFILVNLYGKPYNDPAISPDISLGVPLKLDMAVNDSFFVRNTVAEVYAQIEKDFLDGAILMKTNPQTTGIFKMNEQAAYTMLSRVYLYQEKWDQVIEYANKALAIKSTLAQLSNFTAAGGTYAFNNGFSINNYPGYVANRVYDPIKSNEIIWNYIPNNVIDNEVFRSSISPTYSAVNNPPYAPSDELMSLYETYPLTENAVYLGDLRHRLSFTGYAYAFEVVNGALAITGMKLYVGNKGALGLRVAELYLNRVEANIHKFLNTGDVSSRIAALDDINKLRASRYDTRKAYVPIAITDGAELLNFYKDERRREFAFEGHRWFDLRRYGMPPITHEYNDGSEQQIFELKAGDSRYTLPIPKVVLDRSPLLIQNP